MTCYGYETLRVPAPAADAPMAHHFVKWWRNKFRNGYKKFSIGTESERTDTEELVGRAASQCSAPPDLLPSEARALLLESPPPRRPRKHPPSPPHSNSHEDKQPRMRFEELTCDVEMQHPEPSKQQPLQFSFTLYDLDGHGRMTKDDIAGIVSTIYESLGKSVTVPHYGSKTIQVRLTVVPEDGSGRTQRERRRRRRRERDREREREPAAPQECGEQSDDEPRDRLSPDDDVSSKSSSSDRRRPQPATPPQQTRHHRHSRRDQRDRRHPKKRSGSLQRRELLEIIQANMEKNHLNFQTSRKTDTIAEEEIVTKFQKHRNRSHTISEKPISNTFQKGKTENSGHGYLDLANAGGDSHLCRYDRYLHAVICSSAKHAHTGFHQKQTPRPRQPPTANRSRSHDLPHRTPDKSAHPKILQIIFL